MDIPAENKTIVLYVHHQVDKDARDTLMCDGCACNLSYNKETGKGDDIYCEFYIEPDDTYYFHQILCWDCLAGIMDFVQNHPEENENYIYLFSEFENAPEVFKQEIEHNLHLPSDEPLIKVYGFDNPEDFINFLNNGNP